MRVMIRNFISSFINSNTKKKLKKLEFNAKKKINIYLPKIGEKELMKIICEDFNIKRGDHVFIHASLSLVNTDVTSQKLLDLLLGVVGESGSVSVPCFPAMSSDKYLLRKSPHNYLTSKSGMGEFSECVRKHPDAIRSLHPTKSIASIGLKSSYLMYDDENYLYPFSEFSPFKKLLKKNVKVLGIGVPMSYLSFVHAAEDFMRNEYPVNIYNEDNYVKSCVNYQGETFNLTTKAHNLSIVGKANPYKFVKKYLDRKYWMCRKLYLTPFFYVDGAELTNVILTEAKKGNTIYD
ncbi:AAC(3) family N-acetyltransferase [Aliivibrio sp. S2TY2]|uniref:AAC(3) family N-acetyltransferase n=1 Tax=unclassified Aliivibrio TaxID=2645654 RepID=UPI002378F283|nr:MULTISPECIES: AAC(3) family N-acetyltransferase [unclassified Aliivibrio]MDD9174891.1 AAC(3) family N-acetyltransferase [Aliivibrio sp. S3TY1]MDD9192162.1 AAC(3) family N-acetyltransferase [Aliivibrio sp. S2TY2]